MRNQLKSSRGRSGFLWLFMVLTLMGCTTPQQHEAIQATVDPSASGVHEAMAHWQKPPSDHVEGVRQWLTPALAWGDLGGWVLLPEAQWSRIHWTIAIDPYGQPHRAQEQEETMHWVPGSGPSPATEGLMQGWGCVSCHQESANQGRYPLYKLGSSPQTAAVLSMLEMHDDRHRTQLTLGLRYPKGKPVQLVKPVRCASCHESLAPLLHRAHNMGEGMGGCASCHGGADAARGTNNQKGCSYCHEAGWNEGGGGVVRTKSCAQCHPEPFTGVHRKGHGGLECLDCHGGVHGGHGVANPMLTGDKEDGAEPHCGGCHQVDGLDRPVPRENLYEDRWLSLVRAHWGREQDKKPLE